MTPPDDAPSALLAGAAPVVLPQRGDPLWYKDAIIYQLHVKAFFDSTNDGIGDFQGLTQKLDYLQRSRRHRALAAAVLSLAAARRRLRHRRVQAASIRPMAAWPTSRRSSARRTAAICASSPSWSSTTPPTSIPGSSARAARQAGSPWRNYYVWSDTDKKFPGTRIIFLDTEKSNWAWDPEAQAYYWHRFYAHQPDLNFDNPRVFRAIANVMRFWLDLGVDGLRLDAVPYLIEREGTSNENLPETHEVLRRLRHEMDRRYGDRMLLAEANQWPEDVLPLFRHRRRMPHGVPLPADAAHLHGGRDRGPPSGHRHPAADAGDPGELPVGGVFAQP